MREFLAHKTWLKNPYSTTKLIHTIERERLRQRGATLRRLNMNYCDDE